MTARTSHVDADGVDGVVERACSGVAPTWPLDRFIAVNPFWELVGRGTLPEVSTTLGGLTGTRLLMPRSWFLEAWQRGRLRDEHLAAAISESGADVKVADLHALMRSDAPAVTPRARVVDVADAQRKLDREMSFGDLVTLGCSQFCAAYFDGGQASLPPRREGGLYASWRRQALHDRSPRLLVDFAAYPKLVQELPERAREMIVLALRDLEVPEGERQSYLTSLLLGLNGWAAWCAYERWTARLAGNEDGHIVDLLAMLLAWEWLLHRAGGAPFASQWRVAMAAWPTSDATSSRAQAHDWLLQKAIEIAFQRELCERLPPGFVVAAASSRASVQAAFCIDVRSEVFRRALEKEDENLQTLGFAGFFGMPIEYLPLGSASARPQLPGLLAPKLRVTDTGAPPSLATQRASRLGLAAVWKSFKTSGLSSFAFVESLGLLFGGKLAADSFGLGRGNGTDRAGLTPSEDASRKPRLTNRAGGGVLDLDERCTLAEGILRAMSLTRDFARVVLLVGHGSRTRNNPHGAGLDCGACCGQTGEVNARAAAALMNDPAVKAGLSARGLAIPTTTHFVAALHDTTTDAVTLYDLDELPPSHREDVAVLRRSLDRAAERARRERSTRLGLSALSGEPLRRAMEDRAHDWAEVRPEWGLANNAALVVAPRSRSRHLDLAGRAFLHDYRFEDDPDFAILELIMTAPMVVTHWINLQYYASTVDNLRYGERRQSPPQRRRRAPRRVRGQRRRSADRPPPSVAPRRRAVGPRAAPSQRLHRGSVRRDRRRPRETRQDPSARRRRVAPSVPARRQRPRRARATQGDLASRHLKRTTPGPPSCPAPPLRCRRRSVGLLQPTCDELVVREELETAGRGLNHEHPIEWVRMFPLEEARRGGVFRGQRQRFDADAVEVGG